MWSKFLCWIGWHEYIKVYDYSWDVVLPNGNKATASHWHLECTKCKVGSNV